MFTAPRHRQASPLASISGTMISPRVRWSPHIKPSESIDVCHESKIYAIPLRSLRQAGERTKGYTIPLKMGGISHLSMYAAEILERSLPYSSSLYSVRLSPPLQRGRHGLHERVGLDGLEGAGPATSWATPPYQSPRGPCPGARPTGPAPLDGAESGGQS
jgi:hypothetical protein